MPMNTASVSDLKEELKTLKPAQLAELCLRLSRFKKENKELLTYLLFEAHNEEAFVTGIKKEIDELFAEINLSHLYFAKKSLRKIVRIINKYCRYSSIKQTEVDLRLYFCTVLKGSGIPIERNTIISNLYHSQLKKIDALLKTLHEDLRYDYSKVRNSLN
jgi:hypothetical protein